MHRVAYLQCALAKYHIKQSNCSNDDLEPNDDKGSFVKADTIYQETGAHARGETTQTAEGGPEASDKTVHCRIIRISSIHGLVKGVDDHSHLLSTDADPVET